MGELQRYPERRFVLVDPVAGVPFSGFLESELKPPRSRRLI